MIGSWFRRSALAAVRDLDRHARVVAGPAVPDVAQRPTVEMVVTDAADERVPPAQRVADDSVAIQDVVPGVPADDVVAGPADRDVVAHSAGDAVAAVVAV